MLISGRHIFPNCTCNNLFAIPPLCIAVINAAKSGCGEVGSPGKSGDRHEKWHSARRKSASVGAVFFLSSYLFIFFCHRRLPGTKSIWRAGLSFWFRFVTSGILMSFSFKIKQKKRASEQTFPLTSKVYETVAIGSVSHPGFDVNPAERTCAPRLPISVDIFSSRCQCRQWQNIQIC